MKLLNMKCPKCGEKEVYGSSEGVILCQNCGYEKDVS